MIFFRFLVVALFIPFGVAFLFKRCCFDDSHPTIQYEVRDVTKTLKDALGFLKDWVTSIIQIETALLGAVGAAVILKDRPDISLTELQLYDLLFTAIAFGASICCGIMLLNMLPGAVQRVPKNWWDLTNDIYSITTKGSMRIYDWSWWFRTGFFFGIAGTAVFVLLRVLQPSVGAPSAYGWLPI